jgi:hypothetical protein
MSAEVYPEDVIKAQLPTGMSAKKRGEVAAQIVEALAQEGMLVEGECWTVMVGDALVPVETVETYGLVLKLDANGEASEISSRAGLVVLA